jgi:hypothetical protein
MTVQWMDFSGAPPFLLPERCLPLWNGMFVPLTDLEESDDLELPDGQRFRLDDTLDFKNPITDYDRLCAASLRAREPLVLFPVGDSFGLYVHDPSDGNVGWWGEQQLLITMSHALPDPDLLDGLEWSDEVRWEIETAEIVLFNPTLHGADLANHPNYRFPFYLQPGVYSVMAADYTDPVDDFFASLYRFRLVSR